MSKLQVQILSKCTHKTLCSNHNKAHCSHHFPASTNYSHQQQQQRYSLTLAVSNWHIS